jgi:hypothetical protein
MNTSSAMALRSLLVTGVLVLTTASSCSSGDDSTANPAKDGGIDSATDAYAPDTSNGDSATTDAPGSDASEGGALANILIADQYNNRVIEIDPASKNVVWTFGDGANAPGPTSVVAPNDAERLPSGETLISGTGTGAGTGKCPADAGAGCLDNRVLIVGADKTIHWQFGGADAEGGTGPLSSPVCARLVHTNGSENVLITDQGNARIIEVKRSDKSIVWQFPPVADASATQLLNNPNSAERLANGHTLIADEGGFRVIEVANDGTIAWQYPATVTDGGSAVLGQPAYASRLPNNHTLITDSTNNRIIELDNATTPNVVLTYSTATRNPAMAAPLPTRAVRLANGNTLISDQLNNQVIEIDSATPAPHIVFTYGDNAFNSGSGPNQLFGPYDAKVIGDFTGLTNPN